MKHLLVVIATALVIASCSAGEKTSTTSVEVAKNQISEENPYSLTDIPGAQTTLAKNETEIFTGTYGYYGDLIIPNFSCEAISRVTPWNVNVCALGGTNESPFALVIGDESIDRQFETATTTLLFSLFVPTMIDKTQDVRAVRVTSGVQKRTLGLFDSLSTDILRVNVGPSGTALAIQMIISGGSRTWNEIEMIGLNHFGSVQVVAKFKGEGVAEFADGKGFIFTNYHYAETKQCAARLIGQSTIFDPAQTAGHTACEQSPATPTSIYTTKSHFGHYKKLKSSQPTYTTNRHPPTNRGHFGM